MIALEVHEEELVIRLLKRGQESGRSDDQLSVIKNRIADYERDTYPVIDFYRKMNKYRSVNGVGTVDEIFQRIVAVVEEMK